MPATIENPTIPAPAQAAAQPKPEILVSQMPPPSEPIKPPKPGSAKSRLVGALQKKAGVEPVSDTETPVQAPLPKSTTSPAESHAPPREGGDESLPSYPPTGKEAPAAAPAEKASGDKQKPNPWKLYDAEKAARAKAEKEIQDLKSTIVPEAERTKLMERVTAAEKRAQELEDEIRFVDYSKSVEFQTKYQKPYEEAWKRAMAELSQVPIKDPATGETRSAQTEDLSMLVNMPLGQAREAAEVLFGKFAGDAMNYRKEIRGLFEAQHAALEEAKKTGSERSKRQMEEQQRTVTELKGQISKLWKDANDQALASETHGPFFKPKEGDEEWNARLTKGFEMVDKAFAESPFDNKLTPEQRAEVIKRHAAVRNRAASWGPLRHAYNKALERIKALETEVAAFKGSTPPAGGSQPTTAPTQPASPRARMMEELQRRAKVI